MGRDCHARKEVDVMLLTILGMIAGLGMVGSVIILILAVIAVFAGITTHNLLSMLALAGAFGATASVLQWLLRKFSFDIREKHIYSEPNNQQNVPNGKQNIHFDPWMDEWYGSGPWWKKW